MLRIVKNDFEKNKNFQNLTLKYSKLFCQNNHLKSQNIDSP
jgi:hypothetical protein